MTPVQCPPILRGGVAAPGVSPFGAIQRDSRDTQLGAQTHPRELVGLHDPTPGPNTEERGAWASTDFPRTFSTRRELELGLWVDELRVHQRHRAGRLDCHR